MRNRMELSPHPHTGAGVQWLFRSRKRVIVRCYERNDHLVLSEFFEELSHQQN